MLAAAPGYAQSSDNPVTVNNSTAARTAVPPPTVTAEAKVPDPDRDALEPLGIHSGPITVLPRLETSLGYSDNLYANNNKVGDGVAHIAPAVGVNGDFGVYTLAMRAIVDRSQYFDHSTEDRTDWSLGSNARWEPRRKTYVNITGGYSHAHEDRSDPDSPFAAKRPTTYDLGEAGATISTDLTRLKLSADVSYRGYRFQNGRQIGTGGLIDNKDRNRDQVAVAGRAGYEFSPGYVLVARLAYDTVDYGREFDDYGVDRDSDGWRATGGLAVSISNLVSGEIYAGYLERHYQDAVFETIHRPVFGAAVTWTPSERTTIRLVADRSVQETSLLGYNSFVTTAVTLRAQRQLRPDLTLAASARYGRDDYVRAAIDPAPSRHDNNYGASFSARYAFSRNFYLLGSYDYARRGTSLDEPGIRFNRNRITITAGAQL